jgi:RHS repeat-associated protein
MRAADMTSTTTNTTASTTARTAKGEQDMPANAQDTRNQVDRAEGIGLFAARTIRRTLAWLGTMLFGFVISLTLANAAQAALSVSITGPANNTVALAPANFTLTAVASNAQGAPIQSVAFYANDGTTNTLLGTVAAPTGAGAVTLPPQAAAKAPIATASSTSYTWNWSSVPMGVYSVTAVVTDKKGGTATSTPVTLVSDVPPTVSLTAPANNTVVTAPASFALSATATAPIGTIAKVEFYNGTTLIGTATTAPYSFTWSNVRYGTYSITVKATDNWGITNTSVPVTVIANEPPAVSLTAPADNTVLKTLANNTGLTADAADIDGTIAKVDFYAASTDANGSITNTLVGTATTAPYSYQWNNIPVGQYTLTAVATDNYGAGTTSSPIHLTVKPGEPVPYYIHTDQMDTPREITDTGGNVVWRWDNTDPYGNNTPNQNPNNQGTFSFNLRFPGQYADVETNLAYNVNRDYDSSIGRYIQSDLIGLAGGVNSYIYVENNPISKTDPVGLATYMCTRNLNNVPFSIGPLYHQYICVPDGKGGQTCGGLGPSGSNPFNTPGVIEYENSSSTSSSCKKTDEDNSCIEKCIQDDFKKTPPTYSMDLSNGQNCQTWADHSVSVCEAKCRSKK